MPPLTNAHLGRTAASLAALIGKEIAEGQIPCGRFLPPERELAERHAVDRKTVRRALKVSSKPKASTSHTSRTACARATTTGG